MFYAFAHNLTSAETRGVIARHNANLGMRAFIEAERDEFVIFNYVLGFDGTFPDLTGDPVQDREAAIIRECRGITFDKATGEVVARKFHKFFNVNQREETAQHAIDWSQPHTVLSKADGSMITPYLRPSTDEIEWHTKMGLTEVAGPVNAFASRYPKFEEVARHFIERDMTPIFEWVSREQKIIIDYPVDDLILLAIRDNRTGDYMTYDRLVGAGNEFDVSTIGQIEGDVTDPDAFLAAVRALEGEEGYVVRFDNGHMVKVKAEHYVRLHNMAAKLQVEKNVLELVLSSSLDDAKSLMTEDSRNRVEQYVEAIQRGAADYGARLKEYADREFARVGGDQKRFAVESVNVDAVVTRDRQFLFRIVRGSDPAELILDHVRKNTNSSSRVDEVRDLIGNVRWDDFRDHSIVLED